MNRELLFQFIEEFCQGTHGSTDYGKDEIYICGHKEGQYAPLSFIKKKYPEVHNKEDLLKEGMVYQSYELLENSTFTSWYEKQFSRKLSSKLSKNFGLLYDPDRKAIFSALESVNECYEVLRKEFILLNSKNFPVQVGEWYAKCIFGLKQLKSSSQRGFDFFFNEKRVEVKVHWSEKTSHKGVKIKKTLAELSDWVIVIYLAKNFMVRDICLLDSEFILRKFAGKGHTIFLKDSDVASYFFSKSSKHFDKVLNMKSLLQFASPNFALKLDEKMRSQ